MSQTVTIQDLKKNDTFSFNNKEYTVARKYISDEKPLIAKGVNISDGEERFYHEGLSVQKLNLTVPSDSPVSKKEFNEAKEYLQNGGKYSNDVADYFIFIRKDGQMVFCVGGKYKEFFNIDKFVRAAVRTVKRGY